MNWNEGLTDAINQQAGQNEVEDVEHGPTSQLDNISDVRIGFHAAGVILIVPDGFEAHKVELAVSLVICCVTFVELLY